MYQRSAVRIIWPSPFETIRLIQVVLLCNETVSPGVDSPRPLLYRHKHSLTYLLNLLTHLFTYLQLLTCAKSLIPPNTKHRRLSPYTHLVCGLALAMAKITSPLYIGTEDRTTDKCRRSCACLRHQVSNSNIGKPCLGVAVNPYELTHSSDRLK